MLALLILILGALPQSLYGADFAWPASPYPYSVVDQDLKAALHELGRNVGIRMHISDKVTGRVKGRIQHRTSKEFFAQICSSYGLEWYFDGFTMHISSSEENQSRMINTTGFRTSEIKSRLQSSGIYDERFPLRAQSKGHYVVVFGPPIYIELVEQMVSSLTLADARTVLYRGESVSVVKFGAVKEEKEHN